MATSDNGKTTEATTPPIIEENATSSQGSIKILLFCSNDRAHNGQTAVLQRYTYDEHDYYRR
jgi:hypothetical protein